MRTQNLLDQARQRSSIVKRLAISMQQIGLMTPITVRYHDNIPSSDSDDSHELVTGRHRVAAAQSLGWEEIDASAQEAIKGRILVG
jgi:ParB-like chromosome segregation protein Spo0J